MLLSNLSLGYELLADDPIEYSIHYGESILQFVSSKIQQAVSPEFRAQPVDSPDNNQITRQFFNLSRPVSARKPSIANRVQSSQLQYRQPDPVLIRRDVQRSSYGFNLRPRSAKPQNRTVISVI